MRRAKHGTEYMYNRNACRCQPCKSAHAAKQAHGVAERAALLSADPTIRPHGNASTYKNWGCRCDSCVAVGVAQRRAALARRRKERTGTSVGVRAGMLSSAYNRSTAYRRIKPFGREWLNDDSVHAGRPGADNRVDRTVPRDHG